MKAKRIISLIISVLTIGAIATATFFTSAEYSSADDPLVTLSYINEKLVPEIEKRVTEKVLATLKEEGGSLPEAPTEPEEPTPPEKPEEKPSDEPTETIPSADLNSLKYTVVHLTKGQKLFANGENTESLEVILRAGDAASISPFEDQGIADLTASAQLYNGDPLVKNNYCIIPRGQDGRGVEILSEEAYLLVRGVYEVE